jgi:NhaP-type Na+/H+ or K+/H+ antiporter
VKGIATFTFLLGVAANPGALTIGTLVGDIAGGAVGGALLAFVLGLLKRALTARA